MVLADIYANWAASLDPESSAHVFGALSGVALVKDNHLSGLSGHKPGK